MAEEGEKGSKAKAWTEGEKLDVLFQLIEKAGSMSKLLDEITLPEGRTKRGVSQMLDKEKIKIKKAKDAEGGAATGGGDDAADAKGDGAKTPKAKGGKRKTEGEGSPKKQKTPRKKKAAAAATEETEEAVKDEPAEDDV